MRSSNSKEKQTYTQKQQRNSKTSQSTRVAITPQTLNLNAPLTVKVENSQKNLLPPQPPQPPQKVQYKVDINMTESKIFQAKQGLQLLKKKMERTGMSREKTYIKTQNNTQRGNQKQISASSQNNVAKKHEDKKEKTVRLKQIEKNEVSKQQENSNFINKRDLGNKVIDEDRPISKQVDFMQLVEREIQNQKSLQQKKNQISKQRLFDQNGDQVILEQCHMGCGRNFHPNAIQKHQKICRKVFQSKRKAFNSAAFRQPEVEGIKAFPSKNNPHAQQKLKKKNQIPKWKVQSAQLRAGLKSMKNVPLSKEQQKILTTQQNDFKQCPCCGRKFNQKAAQKHIPFCQKKSKQIHKRNVGIRK